MVAKLKITPDEYDSPWKDAMEHAFPEFMAFYFPLAHSQIDWSIAYKFKNTELRQVIRDAAIGKCFADVLVQVMLKSGSRSLVYVHVEVQSQRDSKFPRRMYTYNYRLFDLHASPIASFAVLADDDPGWKPEGFDCEILGCRVAFEFPVVKLLQYSEILEQLELLDNPFVLITAAHLRTQQTKGDDTARYHAKRALVRSLYKHGWDRRRILDFFAVIDWMMRIPDGLEQKFLQEVHNIEGKQKMRYVTSIERLGIQQGMQQGYLSDARDSVIENLETRFGSVPKLLKKRITQIDDMDKLRELRRKAILVPSIKEFSIS